jgi:hypothetical protein
MLVPGVTSKALTSFASVDKLLTKFYTRILHRLWRNFTIAFCHLKCKVNQLSHQHRTQSQARTNYAPLMFQSPTHQRRRYVQDPSSSPWSFSMSVNHNFLATQASTFLRSSSKGAFYEDRVSSILSLISDVNSVKYKLGFLIRMINAELLSLRVHASSSDINDDVWFDHGEPSFILVFQRCLASIILFL